MNDFTKEELQEILECLPFSCHKKLGFAPILYKKVQSLIENYCEHEICGLCNQINCEDCLCR